MDLNLVFQELTKGFVNFTLGNLIMIVAGCVLIYLAIAKEFEPVLLLPIGMGCVMRHRQYSHDGHERSRRVVHRVV